MILLKRLIQCESRVCRGLVLFVCIIVAQSEASCDYYSISRNVDLKPDINGVIY